MLRKPAPGFLAAMTLAVFALAQLSPLGLSWCQTADGDLHVGCCCAYCACSGADAPGDNCGSEQCPSCGHELASTAGGASHSPALCAQCCEHVPMQYVSLHSTLRAPAVSSASATRVATWSAALTTGGPNRSTHCAFSAPPPWHRPGLAASGAIVLPLRI